LPQGWMRGGGGWAGPQQHASNTAGCGLCARSSYGWGWGRAAVGWQVEQESLPHAPPPQLGGKGLRHAQGRMVAAAVAVAGEQARPGAHGSCSCAVATAVAEEQAAQGCMAAAGNRHDPRRARAAPAPACRSSSCRGRAPAAQAPAAGAGTHRAPGGHDASRSSCARRPPPAAPPPAGSRGGSRAARSAQRGAPVVARPVVSPGFGRHLGIWPPLSVPLLRGRGAKARGSARCPVSEPQVNRSTTGPQVNRHKSGVSALPSERAAGQQAQQQVNRLLDVQYRNLLQACNLSQACSLLPGMQPVTRHATCHRHGACYQACSLSQADARLCWHTDCRCQAQIKPSATALAIQREAQSARS
jgi:hypothetical protein